MNLIDVLKNTKIALRFSTSWASLGYSYTSWMYSFIKLGTCVNCIPLKYTCSLKDHYRSDATL